MSEHEISSAAQPRGEIMKPPSHEAEAELADIKDAIRTFCQSLGAGSVTMSYGVERIYHAGISLDALAAAVALRLAARLAPRPSDAVRNAFRNADNKDWFHLDLLLGDSGHGRFWRAVFEEVRAALTAPNAVEWFGVETSKPVPPHKRS